MSLREFTRTLKVAPIKEDVDLFRFVKHYDPSIRRRTGVRALGAYVVKQIDSGANFRTLTELFAILNDLLPKIVSATLSKDFFHTLRVAVANKYGEGSAEHKKTIEKMKLPKKVYDQIRRDYNEHVIRKNKNKKQIDGKLLNKIIAELKRSVNVIDNIILLQLACGARVGELIYASKFQVVRRKNIANMIKQIDLLKTKDKRGVIKPVLYIGVGDFLQRFNRVRDELERMTNKTGDELARFLNPQINKRVKVLFNDTQIKSHDLRRMYADVAYKVFANKDRVSQQAYLADVLGHDPNDVDIAKSYSTLNVNIDGLDVKGRRQMRGREEEKCKKGEEGKRKQEEKKGNEPVDPPVAGVSQTRVPRNTTARDGKAGERLLRTVEALKHNGVKITARKLYEYGYGRRIVQQYLTGLKAKR